MFFVTCLSSIFKTAASSFVTCELNWVPISVMTVIGKYVCLHEEYMIFLAIAGAVIHVTGYANK